MNVYDYIQSFAEAIRDDADVLAYCKSEFDSGLFVQIDDDAEAMLGSDKAPYCLLHSVPGSEDSPVSAGAEYNLRIEIGTVPASGPPYLTETTPRTQTANGLSKYGQGEKAVDLLDLCFTAIRAVALGASVLMETSSVEADGTLLFPLQVAASRIAITETNDLSTF